MDELSAEEHLYQLWMVYTAKNDVALFKNYLKAFLEAYSEYIDIELTHLNEGFMPEGPHLTRLPEGLLQVVSRQLAHCTAISTVTIDLDTLSFAEDLTKCLIVICRNFDNVSFVSTCEYATHLITIATGVLAELSKGNTEVVEQLSSFVRHALHFFECMYDPYFVWRKHLKGWHVDKNRLKFQPAQLHVEIVPFFYECFQQVPLDVDVQMRLFHVFGAIVSGDQNNALRAICPATLDVLLKALSFPNTEHEGPCTREDVARLKQLVLKCLVQVVHVIHTCLPDQRQVEVGAVLEGYFQVLLGLDEHSNSLQLEMLNAIHSMLQCEDQGSLQVIFVAEGSLEMFLSFLQKMSLTGVEAQKAAMAIIRVMNSVISGSPTAQQKFGEKVGYFRFVDALKSLGQPSQELLSTLLDLVCEDMYRDTNDYPIRNTQAALMLIQWLPDIQSHDLQIWLSQCLKRLCCHGNHNRMHCCNAGMISAISSVLSREKQINPKAVGNLIDTLESLGTLSVTTSELKQLLKLLRMDEEEKQNRYLPSLMHAMSVMARKEGKEGALYYFDFEKQDSGILVPEIGKWPGTAFTFHTWVCLDNEAPLVKNISHLARRQLYSFTTSAGSGFEAFFTAECVLVVATSMKKDYHAIQVSEGPITDQQWHCVDVVHAAARSAFSPSQLSVYIDGRLKLSAQLKFPQLTESFVHCKVGSPGISVCPRDANSDPLANSTSHSAMSDFKSKLGKVPRLAFRLPIPAAMKASVNQSTTVLSLNLGSQDEHWGVPLSLVGQVGSVCVFHDALTQHQVKNMYAAGPNCLSLFQSEDNGLSELASKLVLHYNAKGSESAVCLDLSSQHHHGRVVGSKCVTWDIKDVINCVGGIQVVFPLLEQVGKLPAPTEERDPLLQPPLSPRADEVDEGSDWVVVPSSSYADAKLEQNQVAGFLTLLRNLIQSSPINQETLVRENAVSSLGMLLQKCDISYIDVHVLMAIQLLEEAISMVNKTLLHHVYQYLLFDFRIWSKSEFPVRIGHIQYLSTIIKDDKKYFRKKYGVQYMLDIMRTYYSTPEDAHLSVEDSKTIRGALISLIKYYVYKEITYEELSQLMAFIVAVKEEELIGEVLDLLIHLLEAPGKRDQIYLLLYEPKMAELFYRFLSVKEYASKLKEKVLRILSLLLKTDKVYDKNKSKLRLLDSGTYPGLVGEMLGSQVSYSMARQMLEQVLATESEAGINAALYIIQLLQHADMDTKLEASRKLMSALFAKSKAPRLFAKQRGWQESISRLFILRPRTVDRSISGTSFDQVPANQLSDQPEPLIEVSDGVVPGDTEVPSFNLLDLSDSAAETALKACLHPPSKDFTLPLSVITANPGLNDLQMVNGAPSPQFSKIGLFDDPSWSDLEGSGGLANSSRSSSTSVEDLNQGARRSSSSVSLSRSSPSDPNMTPSTETTPSGPLSSQTPDMENVDSRSLSDSQSSSNLKTIAEEADIATAIQRMGLTLARDENLEKTEELCQNLLVVLFTIMWKGVDTSDVTQAWKERGQVFAALTYAEENNNLLKMKVELERKLVEMMLQGCIMDLKETGITNSIYTENALQLIKLVYYYLCIDSQPARYKFNERIIEDVMTLLDLMTVFDVEDGWREMEQLGLSILLAFAEQDDLDLCSIASARLHTLLQTRPVEKLQESCFVMAKVESILVKSLDGSGDQYNFLIPVMKALVDKCKDMLNMDTYLPGLPTTQMSPSFFDDFKRYCLQEEWRTFMRKQVLPSKEQYLANSFDLLQVAMKTYIGECHELMMNNTHKRNRERGESKLKFQSQILELFLSRAKQENKRYQNIVAQLRNQHSAIMRQWRTTKQFFTGERGVWAERTQAEAHWKMSPQENFCRMRPKLVSNYNFDKHTDASRLRDNLGVEEKTTVLPPIALAKAVNVSDEDIGDDRLGDEEWNMISSAAPDSVTEENVGKEKLVISEECELVTVMENVKGRLEVTTTHIYFFDASSLKEEGVGEDFKLPLTQLREMHFRRYNLRRSALELFLIDQTNYFLNFEEKARNKMYGKIASLRPANLIHAGSRSPSELLKASGLTQKWVQREISNFEYLMQLNTIAGRTYNDLSQYPVFPWVLRDYKSEVLDLDNPDSYRDLSRPIGVVNPKNEREVQEKFEHFEDPSGTIEKFHYGTHYSNAAGVMHFLLRVEPLATLHIQLQSGRFDVADRQFHSIPGTWQCLMDNPNDVKELIPEFFYLPEFLENMNNFDLGKLQITKDGVDNVILPTWASSPDDFINKHMKALESEYVSSHLHEWIDLIFGYKQKGQAAVEAFNVFYYCTYEGAVDLDAITDPIERKALEGMINNFGQTPRQLLKEPHPKRMAFEEAVTKSSKVDKPLSVLLFLDRLKAFYVEASVDNDPLAYVCVPRNQARSFIQVGMPDSMIGVSEEGVLAVHGWLPYDKSISNYFTFDRDLSLNSSKNKRKTTGSFAPGLHVNPRLFTVSHDAKLIFSAGHWDNSVRVYNISKSKNVAHVLRHTDVVTCLNIDHCGNHLITGSRDTTCMIWQINQQSGSCHNLNPKPLQILCGHDAEVTCVAISIALDLAVSGSKDGTVIVHTVRKGMYMKTLRPCWQSGWKVTVEQLAISDAGQICVYCRHTLPSRTRKEESLSLHLYSINGKHLCSEEVYSPIADMLICNGNLIFGNNKGVLVIKELFGLKTKQTVPLHLAVTCVAVTPNASHILAGLRDGKLIIVGMKKQSEFK